MNNKWDSSYKKGATVGLKILLNEAIDAMQPTAAQSVLDLAQMLAENYPKKMGLRLVGAPKSIDMDVLRMFAETSPTGICIVSWPNLEVIWSNNVYKDYFVDLESREVNTGVRLADIIPGFTDVGMDEIFDGVAESGEPFRAQHYPLMLPSCGMTHWNWTLTRFPAAGDQEMKLLVQMSKAEAPARQQKTAA